MDRIFHKVKIESICDDLNKSIKESQEYIEKIKTAASDAETAATDVPADVREASIATAAADISDIDTESIDTILSNLGSCKEAVGTLIPDADKAYAEQTDELVTQVESLQEVARQIKEFLVDTPLTQNYNDFISALDVASKSWSSVMEDTTESINKLLMNIKGEDVKSIWYSKDPVNLSTGNFVYDKVDLEIKGEEPFIFRRVYNAINNRRGVLGEDWNHNYEICLETDKQEKVLLLEDGKEERFILTSVGTYASVYNGTGELKKLEEGYEYSTREQVRYIFDEEGYLIKHTMLKGLDINFFYEDSLKKKVLCKIEKETGEFFKLTYDKQGYLNTVMDHTRRRITYEFTNNKLKRVSTATGNWFQYEYSASGKLEQVINPENIVNVENIYDEKMRTVKQTFPDGGTMLYAYDDEKREVELTERNGSKITYVHDELFRDIKHIYSDSEEKFEYNKKNQKTVFIDKAGNKTKYTYDAAGNRTGVINPLGIKVDMNYNELNKLTKVAIDGQEKVHNKYDNKGRLIETKDALGNTYKYRYKENGRMSGIIQPDGGLVTFEHDKRGNITCLTDPNRVRHRFRYDDLNQVVETVDGNGNVTRYSYDQKGNITQVKNANGDTRIYTYNKNDKVIRIENFDGSVVKREYNVLNKPGKIIDEMGHITELSYDAMWNLTRVTKNNGAKTTFVYNEQNKISRIRNANGDVVRYSYDVMGNRIGMTNELGHKTSFAYDAMGRLVKAVSPEGNSAHYTYNAEGKITKAEDALGNEVHLAYDACGQLIRETNPLGESRSYTYTSMGKVETVTDEAGLVTRYSYDKGGRIAGITYPEGGSVAYTYDKNGNLKSFTNPKGYVLKYSYDSLNNVAKIEGSDGAIKTYAYDSMGNVISMIDANGAVTSYEYSFSGKLTKIIDPMGHETRYKYDDMDYLTEIHQFGDIVDGDLEKAKRHNDLNYKSTSYEHDILGRVTKITDSIGCVETFEYNEAGQLLAKVDKEGYLTKYGYTPSGEMNHIQYADGREVKLSYNPIRQLEEINDWLGTTRMESDPLGRTTKVIYPDGREVSYKYGARGERRDITYPDGDNVSYEYDEYARLSGLKHGKELVSYKYDDTGLLVGKGFPNGTRTHYSYDNRGQLASLVHMDASGPIDSYMYEYDRTGNRTSIRRDRRNMPDNSGLFKYSYDVLGRIMDITKDDAIQQSFTYDDFGNRISMVSDGETTNYAYNEMNQLIGKTDAESVISYKYDKRGNLNKIFEGDIVKSSFVFGCDNLLGKATNALNETIQYQYSGLGHRVGKRVSSSADMQAEIEYLIDFTRSYNNLLQKEEAGKKQTYLWDYNVVGMTEESDVSNTDYYLQDEQGSPIRLLYHNGEIKESYGYSEFGEAQHEESSQPFGFTGYQYDKESDGYYAQARYYKPEIGRFVSQDLVPGFRSAPMTMNRYTYCFNHPIGLVDRTGLFPTWDDITSTISDGIDTVSGAVSDGINYVGGAIADGVDYIAEAVSGPVDAVCSQVVEWANANPEIRDKVLDTLQPVGRVLFDYSPGVVVFTYATQQGYADGILETFDFHKDGAGIYHTSVDCWQQYLGYNDLYDWAFKVGTDARENFYSVTTISGEEYAIWMWKGDYVNLGAGAETGIYNGGGPHWQIDVNDALPMMLALYDKDGNTIFVYDPTDPQWWITGFDPMIQGVKTEELVVIGSVDFSTMPELWDAFKKELGYKEEWCFDDETKTAYYKW